jgi:hypothetical protein
MHPSSYDVSTHSELALALVEPSAPPSHLNVENVPVATASNLDPHRITVQCPNCKHLFPIPSSRGSEISSEIVPQRQYEPRNNGATPEDDNRESVVFNLQDGARPLPLVDAFNGRFHALEGRDDVLLRDTTNITIRIEVCGKFNTNSLPLNPIKWPGYKPWSYQVGFSSEVLKQTGNSKTI